MFLNIKYCFHFSFNLLSSFWKEKKIKTRLGQFSTGYFYKNIYIKDVWNAENDEN